MKKYFKLVNNTGENQINYLLEFPADERKLIEKRIGFGTKNQCSYLLVEKVINSDSTETYTNVYPVNQDADLLKRIKKSTCWDYTGISINVWRDGKCCHWDQYKQMNFGN